MLTPAVQLARAHVLDSDELIFLGHRGRADVNNNWLRTAQVVGGQPVYHSARFKAHQLWWRPEEGTGGAGRWCGHHTSHVKSGHDAKGQKAQV